MDLASAIVLLLTAVTFGYFGGKEHGFHKLLKALGFDDNKEQKEVQNVTRNLYQTRKN